MRNSEKSTAPAHKIPKFDFEIKKKSPENKDKTKKSEEIKQEIEKKEEKSVDRESSNQSKDLPRVSAKKSPTKKRDDIFLNKKPKACQAKQTSTKNVAKKPNVQNVKLNTVKKQESSRSILKKSTTRAAVISCEGKKNDIAENDIDHSIFTKNNIKRSLKNTDIKIPAKYTTRKKNGATNVLASPEYKSKQKNGATNVLTSRSYAEKKHLLSFSSVPGTKTALWKKNSINNLRAQDQSILKPQPDLAPTPEPSKMDKIISKFLSLIDKKTALALSDDIIFKNNHELVAQRLWDVDVDGKDQYISLISEIKRVGSFAALAIDASKDGIASNDFKNFSELTLLAIRYQITVLNLVCSKKIEMSPAIVAVMITPLLQICNPLCAILSLENHQPDFETITAKLCDELKIEISDAAHQLLIDILKSSWLLPQFLETISFDQSSFPRYVTTNGEVVDLSQIDELPYKWSVPFFMAAEKHKDLSNDIQLLAKMTSIPTFIFTKKNVPQIREKVEEDSEKGGILFSINKFFSQFLKKIIWPMQPEEPKLINATTFIQATVNVLRMLPRISSLTEIAIQKIDFATKLALIIGDDFINALDDNCATSAIFLELIERIDENQDSIDENLEAYIFLFTVWFYLRWINNFINFKKNPDNPLIKHALNTIDQQKTDENHYSIIKKCSDFWQGAQNLQFQQTITQSEADYIGPITMTIAGFLSLYEIQNITMAAKEVACGRLHTDDNIKPFSVMDPSANYSFCRALVMWKRTYDVDLRQAIIDDIENLTLVEIKNALPPPSLTHLDEIIGVHTEHQHCQMINTIS